MSEHESLTRWLRARGAAVHPDLDLYGVRPDGERGVFARRPIAKGDLLLRLPRSAVLSASDGCSATSLAWMPAAARALSPVLRMALCILRECALGETSEWAPYLATLPASYNTLEFWTQPQLEALRGTGVYDELSGLRDGSGDLIGATRVMWDKSVRPIVEASPELWPECSLESFLLACAAGTHVSQLIVGPCVTPHPCHARCPGKREVTRDHPIRCAVRTRGFYDTAEGGGGPYMLPAIDMLNHSLEGIASTLLVERSSAGEASEGDGSDGGEGTLASGGGSGGGSGRGSAGGSAGGSLVFSMCAQRAIGEGEELTHTYDHFDDAQLLLTYGFVSNADEGALPPTARLPLQLLLQGCEAAASRACRGISLHADGNADGLAEGPTDGPADGLADGPAEAPPPSAWDPHEGWVMKRAACERLLEAHGQPSPIPSHTHAPMTLLLC